MVDRLLIRPMTEADIAACLVIEQATYPSPWTEGVFRDELAAPGRSYFVAEDEPGPVGYGGLMVVLPDAHVTSVTVDPKSRGRQIGTRLMLKLARVARDSGAQSLTLEVRFSNKPAQALYGKFGMVPVGVRKQYYRDEDALIMWVHDIDRPEFDEKVLAIEKELT